MKRKIAAFLSVFTISALAFSGAVVYAADMSNTTAVDSSFQASCSDSIGKVYTSPIKSTIKAENSNYNGRWKYTEVTSYNVASGGSASEIDFSNNSGSTRDVTAYLSTTGANTVVAFGGIHTTQYNTSSYARTYLLVCKKYSYTPAIDEWYYNSY